MAPSTGSTRGTAGPSGGAGRSPSRARLSGHIALSVAALPALANLAAVGWRVGFQIRAHGFLHPFLSPPTALDNFFYRVGAYLLPLLVVLLVQLVSKGRKGVRTFAATLWDVMTFWPRRFSPFAVRPYSE